MSEFTDIANDFSVFPQHYEALGDHMAMFEADLQELISSEKPKLAHQAASRPFGKYPEYCQLVNQDMESFFPSELGGLYLSTQLLDYQGRSFPLLYLYNLDLDFDLCVQRKLVRIYLVQAAETTLDHVVKVLSTTLNCSFIGLFFNRCERICRGRRRGTTEVRTAFTIRYRLHHTLKTLG